MRKSHAVPKPTTLEGGNPEHPTIEIGLPADLLQVIVDKAHEYQAKVDVVEPDPGSNPTDEGMREVLEDYDDDPVRDELEEMMSDLNQDQLADLVTLVWLGRGDFEMSDWHEKRAEALALDPKRTPEYLIETPQFADYLSEGLELTGHTLP